MGGRLLGSIGSVGVIPGAAAKSLRMTAASPSRSSPLTHDSNTHIGSQRVAWQVLFHGNASVVDSVEGEGQGVRRFALRIPDESIGTRALPTCPDRRQQVAQQSGQSYLGFRYLELQPRHGPWERWDVIPGPAGCGNVGCWSPDPASWHRSVGLRYGQQGFRYRMTGSSGTAFTPTPVRRVLLLGRSA